MLTAAITHSFYFTFGGDPDRVPEPVGIHELLSPEGLSRSCDSAYRLFYNCLPLYDRLVATSSLLSRSPQAIVYRPNRKPTTEIRQGLVLLQYLIDHNLATLEDQADANAVEGGRWGSDAERNAIRREFLTPELVEWIITSFPFEELRLSHRGIRRWIRRLSNDTLHEVAGRIAASLRGERSSLSRGEEAVEYAVSEVVDHLVAYSGYAAVTGYDVYAFKYYMPLLVARAIQDRTNITGLRSFSLILPVIDPPASYSRARDSFAGLRQAIEGYQTALVGDNKDEVFRAYVKLDEARLAGLKREFDGTERRQLVTVTCLMTTLGGKWQRYFLPDDHFHLSLAMQHWQYLRSD